MLTFRPSQQAFSRFLDAKRSLGFTYADVGASATRPPVGFAVDHTRALLGRGEPAFRTAQAALRRWQHFELGWLHAWPANTPLQSGEVICIAASKFGIAWLNACRIVYVVDDDGPMRRFGFAYGTLPGHAECGEERFLIEWDRASDEVWYDILAFSRPKHWLAKLGYLLVRRLQRRFARDSVAAIRRG